MAVVRQGASVVRRLSRMWAKCRYPVGGSTPASGASYFGSAGVGGGGSRRW